MYMVFSEIAAFESCGVYANQHGLTSTRCTCSAYLGGTRGCNVGRVSTPACYIVVQLACYRPSASDLVGDHESIEWPSPSISSTTHARTSTRMRFVPRGPGTICSRMCEIFRKISVTYISRFHICYNSAENVTRPKHSKCILKDMPHGSTLTSSAASL